MKPKTARMLLMVSINAILVAGSYFLTLWIAILHEKFIFWMIPWGLFVVWFVARGSEEILWHWEFSIKQKEPLPKDIRRMTIQEAKIVNKKQL